MAVGLLLALLLLFGRPLADYVHRLSLLPQTIAAAQHSAATRTAAIDKAIADNQ